MRSRKQSSSTVFTSSWQRTIRKTYVEEVKKGMREKLSQGGFPGHAPFGYRNNKAERTIEIDPVDSVTVTRLFDLYATGAYTLSTLTKTIRSETGKTISRNNVHRILKNQFYVGLMQWTGLTYSGNHPVFIDPQTFERVQAVITGHNRPKYSKKDISFRGLMTCAYDDCMVTGEIQKGKYIYYPMRPASRQMRPSTIPGERHRQSAWRASEGPSGAPGGRLSDRHHTTRRSEGNRGQG